jgi:DNA-binding MarR family transcriptional regulator
MNQPNLSKSTTKDESTDIHATCENIFSLLVERYTRSVSVVARTSDPSQPLTRVQYRVLSYLYENSGGGLTKLADHIGVQNSAASGLVTRLVKHGYVSNELDPAHRRRIELKITKKGEKAFLSLQKRIRAQFYEVLDQMPQDDLKRFYKGLTALAEVFPDPYPTETIEQKSERNSEQKTNKKAAKKKRASAKEKSQKT